MSKRQLNLQQRGMQAAILLNLLCDTLQIPVGVMNWNDLARAFNKLMEDQPINHSKSEEE